LDKRTKRGDSWHNVLEHGDLSNKAGVAETEFEENAILKHIHIIFGIF
jgi:hypothetical protein